MIGDTLTRTKLPDRTAAAKLTVVVRAADAADYDRVLDVLIDAGIRSVELTLTTPGTIDRLPKLLAQFGDAADIGVGDRSNEVVRPGVDGSGQLLPVGHGADTDIGRIAKLGQQLW